MRLLRWTSLVLLIAATALWLTCRLRDPERVELDQRARGEAPGRFVRLEDGMTHYETAGPATGRVVVLAAGFSVPAYIWDSLYQGLADSGFRVIRYDYYGRGWSDRVDAAYDQELFVRQLAGLLDSLRVRGPVDLAGLSFGGAVVTSFTDRYPERVRTLLYFDPVFNARRPLPPEERSAWRWNVHMVLRGGSDGIANGQLQDFLHPERGPTGSSATGCSRASRVPARPCGARERRSQWPRTRRPSSAGWARGGCRSCWSGGGRIGWRRSPPAGRCSRRFQGRPSCRWIPRHTCPISSDQRSFCPPWWASSGRMRGGRFKPQQALGPRAPSRPSAPRRPIPHARATHPR